MDLFACHKVFKIRVFIMALPSLIQKGSFTPNSDYTKCPELSLSDFLILQNLDQDLEAVPDALKNCAVAIGNFDGVHLFVSVDLVPHSSTHSLYWMPY